MGAPAATVDYMITHAPVVMKGGMSLEEARHYADAVQAAGGRATIEADGYAEEPGRLNRKAVIASYEDFTMCPVCGLKQQRGVRCIKCGYTFR
jgi:hypothetical protein